MDGARPAQDELAPAGRALTVVDSFGAMADPAEVSRIVNEIATHLDALHGLIRALVSTADARHVAPESPPLGSHDTSPENELWTIEDVAAYLRRSVRAVRGLRARGELPAPDGPGRRLLWSAHKIKQSAHGRVSSRTPKRSPR